MWQYFVLICSLCTLPLPTSGFWWPKTTTETPRSQVLHQIPLTYFRTYTYQPLTGSPFGVPLFGFGAAQTPLLSGRHYDPYAVTSYAAARKHDAAGAGAASASGSAKQDVTPPALVSSTTAAPSTTTTSTTTTTTPAPTTTSTTTTTTTSAPPTSSTTTESSSRYAEYPTYSRRVNNLYNARPQYPYPDYFNYQPQSTLAEKSGTRIQFVPCMCPVSMPSMSGLSGLNSVSSMDIDRPSGVAISSSPPVALTAATAAEDVTAAEHNVVALQARDMDSVEAELDEEEEQETDASAESEHSDAFVATKVALEPQPTTPPVESNSLL